MKKMLTSATPDVVDVTPESSVTVVVVLLAAVVHTAGSAEE
jgi:hypothetical protein